MLRTTGVPKHADKYNVKASWCAGNANSV